MRTQRQVRGLLRVVVRPLPHHHHSLLRITITTLFNALISCSSYALSPPRAQIHSTPDPHHNPHSLSLPLSWTEKLRALECKKRMAQTMQDDLVVFRQAEQLLKRKAAILNMQLQQVCIMCRYA